MLVCRRAEWLHGRWRYLCRAVQSLSAPPGLWPNIYWRVNAAGLLTFGLWSLPAGLLGGRWGSQRLLIVGLVMMAVGCSALPCGYMPPTWQARWLITTYVCIHIGLALHIANATPFVMAATSATERHHAFALASALWFLAGFAGNLLGELPALFGAALETSLNQPAPYRTLALASASSRPSSRCAPPARPGATAWRSNRGSGDESCRIGWLALARLLGDGGWLGLSLSQRLFGCRPGCPDR